jgi:methyltransferase (TIGR00027 family)
MSTSPWILRARYAEDWLAEAVARGVTQYLILGAGLDTFAYRARDAMSALRVFEVDTPELQAWKRERLETCRIAVPSTCTFVPCDFDDDSLAEAIASSPFDSAQATFVSWLGVTAYLDRATIVDTLDWIAALGTQTELVLTYLVPEARFSPGGQFAARLGLPVGTSFSTKEMEDVLLDCGFGAIQALTVAEARARYFAGRSDGLDVDTNERLIWARMTRL